MLRAFGVTVGVIMGLVFSVVVIVVGGGLGLHYAFESKPAASSADEWEITPVIPQTACDVDKKCPPH